MIRSKHIDLALLLLAPLITLVNGIAIDLYTPSLPAIAASFGISASLAKFSVSIGMIGFGFGVFAFGGLSDNWGRRQLILIGLGVFMLASLSAITAHNIELLLACRFFQGVGVAMAAMLARAALLDHFKGKQLQAALLYTTIAWGLGPIIAPAIGGYLQQYFNWQANFILYAAFSAFVLMICLFLLSETLPGHRRQTGNPLKRYLVVLRNKQFQHYVTLCVIAFTGFVSYGIVGPFVVQTQLGFSPVVFGHTALLVGAGYFSGTLINRFLITRLTTQQLLKLAVSLIATSAAALWILHGLGHLTLASFVAPFVISTLGIGILFPNAITLCLTPFKDHAGSAACLHGGIVMLLGSLTTGLVGLIPIQSLLPIAWLMTAVTISAYCVIKLANKKQH